MFQLIAHIHFVIGAQNGGGAPAEGGGAQEGVELHQKLESEAKSNQLKGAGLRRGWSCTRSLRVRLRTTS